MVLSWVVDDDADEEDELGCGGVLQGVLSTAPSFHGWEMSGLRDEVSDG